MDTALQVSTRTSGGSLNDLPIPGHEFSTSPKEARVESFVEEASCCCFSLAIHCRAPYLGRQARYSITSTMYRGGDAIDVEIVLSSNSHQSF